MHSRSLWLSPTMSSYSPIVNLTVLRNPCWYVSVLVLLSWGAFFVFVSGVVTNARSAHNVGASVVEPTCTVKTSTETDAVSST
jgi:hypothetical protein